MQITCLLASCETNPLILCMIIQTEMYPFRSITVGEVAKTSSLKNNIFTSKKNIVELHILQISQRLLI